MAIIASEDVEWFSKTRCIPPDQTAPVIADYTILRPASYLGQSTLQSAVGVNAVTNVIADV